MHPKLIKQFFDLILNDKENFAYLNMQIIMATHSPVTVNFLNLSNIYEMSLGALSPQPVEKKSAIIKKLSNDLFYLKEKFLIVFVEGYKKVDKEGTLDEIFYNLAFECVVNGESTKQNKTQMYPVKFQSIGNRDFRVIFRKSKTKDERNLNDFIFGINDGDMFIEVAEKFYKKNSQETAEFERKRLENFNQTNYDRLSRYSVESYLYDPINYCIALKNHAKEGVDLGFFEKCVNKMKEYNDLSI